MRVEEIALRLYVDFIGLRDFVLDARQNLKMYPSNTAKKRSMLFEAVRKASRLLSKYAMLCYYLLWIIIKWTLAFDIQEGREQSCGPKHRLDHSSPSRSLWKRYYTISEHFYKYFCQFEAIGEKGCV